MRTSDGGMMRVNEFRRVGWRGLGSVQMSLFGTRGSFEEHADSQVWSSISPDETTNLNELLSCGEVPALGSGGASAMRGYIEGEVPALGNGGASAMRGNIEGEPDSDVDATVLREFHSGVSPVHPVDRLPREFPGAAQRPPGVAPVLGGRLHQGRRRRERCPPTTPGTRRATAPRASSPTSRPSRAESAWTCPTSATRPRTGSP